MIVRITSKEPEKLADRFADGQVVYAGNSPGHETVFIGILSDIPELGISEKIVRQARNSEEQFPTDSADAPQTRRKKKVYQINQLRAKRRSNPSSTVSGILF
jgi:hypothetical protein